MPMPSVVHTVQLRLLVLLCVAMEPQAAKSAKAAKESPTTGQDDGE